MLATRPHLSSLLSYPFFLPATSGTTRGRIDVAARNFDQRDSGKRIRGAAIGAAMRFTIYAEIIPKIVVDDETRGSRSHERDDPQPRARARVAPIRITVQFLQIAFSFSRVPSIRHARVYGSGRTKGKTAIASVIPRIPALAFSLAAETTRSSLPRCGRIETEGDKNKARNGGGFGEQARYTPPRSGCHGAPITALRPIGELCRERKDAISKRCSFPLSTLSPPPSSPPPPPSRRGRDRDRVVP